MTQSNHEKTTHFGFQSVPWQDKEGKVADVFHAVATRYDIMNDLMSLGIHRLWKRFTMQLSQVRSGQRVLDLACGSGDLTRALYQRVGETGQVVATDINASMLSVARDRLLDEGILKGVDFIQGNAQTLPFRDNYFDCIIMGFGLRNVTEQSTALKSMFRVCKPGGKVMILEFSTPKQTPLKPLYDWYSFNILPWLGKTVAQDEASYQYLAESIRMHPPQDELKSMIEQAGFEDCQYHNLTAGIVALHIAYKY